MQHKPQDQVLVTATFATGATISKLFSNLVLARRFFQSLRKDWSVEIARIEWAAEINWK